MIELENIDGSVDKLKYEHENDMTISESSKEIEHACTVETNNGINDHILEEKPELDHNDDNSVIELDRFWPYGLNLDEPTDPKKLYLFAENKEINCHLDCIYKNQDKPNFLKETL